MRYFLLGILGLVACGESFSSDGAPGGATGTGGTATTVTSGSGASSASSSTNTTSTTGQTTVSSSSTGGGCMADLMNDPKNCGSCNHDCLGGDCHQGACRAFHLVNARSTALALDDDRIYMTSLFGSQVEVRLKANPKTPTLTYPSQGVNAIALDANNIYWANDHGISFGSKTGNIAGASCGFQADQKTRGVVIADQNAVFLLNDASNSGLYYCPKTGGSAMKLAAASVLENALIQTSNAFLWSQYWGNKLASLNKVAASGSTISAGGSQNGARGIAADGNNLYFAEATEGVVKKTPLDLAGAITPLATSEPYPYAVAVDGSVVYYSTIGSADVNAQTAAGAIKRVNKSGGSLATVATGQTRPLAIATDAVAIYWVNLGSDDPSDTAGGLWRLAK